MVTVLLGYKLVVDLKSVSLLVKGIDGDTAKDFCWIHGSAYIPPQYQAHMKCIADLEHVESKEDAPWTSYYQWVTFVQLFQVIWRTYQLIYTT